MVDNTVHSRFKTEVPMALLLNSATPSKVWVKISLRNSLNAVPGNVNFIKY
ncbi:mCG147598 [Mus musculus]|jgi:hypothetical protein|nr:mCG147598 [Mus musculus]